MPGVSLCLSYIAVYMESSRLPMGMPHSELLSGMILFAEYLINCMQAQSLT